MARVQQIRRLRRQNKALTRRVRSFKQQQKAYSKALYDPMATLSGGALSSAANQLTDLTIKPQLSALDRQAQTATTQGLGLADRAKGYYADLAVKDRDMLAQQQALGGLLSTAQQAVGQRAQASYDAAAGAEQQRAAADVALRGAGLGGGGTDQVQAEIAAGRGVSAQTQQQQELAGQMQQAGWNNLSALVGQSRELQGQETYGQLLNRLANTQAEIAGKRADVQSTRGQELTKNLLNLRQTGFENQAASLTLGLDQAKLAAQTAQDQAAAKEAAAKRKQQAKQAAADRRAANYRAELGAQTTTANNIRTNQTSRANTQARIRAQRNQPKTETQQAVSLRRAVGNVSAEARALVAEARAGGAGSKAAVRDYVAKKLQRKATSMQQVLPNDVLSAALDLGLDGHVSARNVQRLRQAGVIVPSNWLK